MRNLLFTLVFLFGGIAQASFVSYEAIDAFHKSRLESVALEYNLDKRVQISYSLLPLKNTKKIKNEIVKLPGLFLDSLSLYPSKKEVGLIEIIEALGDYKRKIVILKSSRISDKEIDVVRQALMDELFISDSKSFEVKKWSTKKVWYNDLKTSFRDKVLTSPFAYLGLLAFLIISFLLFSLSSSILNGFKHVGKSIFDSVEKSMATAGFEPIAENNTALDSGGLNENSGNAVVENSDMMSEAKGKAIDCHAILKLLSKALSVKPNELRFHLWDVFPSIQDQLSLYIAFETELGPENMEVFSKLFNSVFQIESGAENNAVKSKSAGVQSALWQLRLRLTHLVVKPLDRNTEKIFGLFSENYSGQIDAIIDGSIKNHFKILSYVFEEKVNARISSLDEFEDEFSDQIMSYVTRGEDYKVPSDLDIRNFEQHLKANKCFLGKSAEKTNARDFSLLSKLSDRVLFAPGKMDEDRLELLNNHIPNFNWIDLSKTKSHKGFILSLTPDEATHFMTHFSNFEEFKLAVDTRTSSRLQELKIKSQNPESVRAVVGLRQKIGRFYTAPEAEKGDELQTAA